MVKRGSFATLLIFLMITVFWSASVDALKCYSCNSAVKGQKTCKGPRDAIDANFLVDCNTMNDVRSAWGNANLTHPGVRYWSYSENNDTLERRKKTLEDIDNNDPNKIFQMPSHGGINDKSVFLCRTIAINIPYQRAPGASNKGTDERVIRLCATMANLTVAGQPEKLNICKNNPASAKTEVISCTCQKDACNGVGPSKKLLNPFLAILLFGFSKVAFLA